MGRIADTVSNVLGIKRGDLLVTDVFGNCMVIDILKRGVDANSILGKGPELLESLSRLPGIRINEKTSISSRGLLSWVSLDRNEVGEAMKRAEKMASEMKQKLKKTVVVFSTGAEVADGHVMDTNSPAIRDRLSTEGYSVKFGPTLKDDELIIAAHLRETAEEGYGLIITTGGVGAEEKDKTIEAVLSLDPEAATPSIVTYELGVGRHKHKNCVRIAVGQVLDTLIIALPGPTDEVLTGIDALIRGLPSLPDKEVLAEDIAGDLRKRLKCKL
ncbi:MAG: molybdopterin-binding protein [Syntrophales bacterium]